MRLWAPLLFLLAGCGGPESGLDRGLNLEDLDSEQRAQICQFMHDVGPKDGEYTCALGQRNIMRDFDGCVNRRFWGNGFEKCTVGALEDCYRVLNDAGTWCGLDLLGPCEQANNCNFSRP